MKRAVRYDGSRRKYINTPLKYYFTDLGLTQCAHYFRQIEQTHLMENVIYNELRIRGYNVDVGLVEIINREADGRKQRKRLEDRFYLQYGSERYYLQSAFACQMREACAGKRVRLLRIDVRSKKSSSRATRQQAGTQKRAF